jgi:hypothetical protein
MLPFFRVGGAEEGNRGKVVGEYSVNAKCTVHTYNARCRCFRAEGMEEGKAG